MIAMSKKQAFYRRSVGPADIVITTALLLEKLNISFKYLLLYPQTAGPCVSC